MRSQRIGSIRVGSFDQNPEQQLAGVSVDRVFTDKASGKDTKRPELNRLLTFAQAAALRKRANAVEQKAALARTFGISR